MMKNWRISGRLVSSFVMKYGSNDNFLKKMLQIRAFFYIMLVDRWYPLKQIKQTWQ